MNNLIKTLVLFSVFLFSGCTSSNAQKSVVFVSDINGNPISGAYESPKVPFGDRRVSNSNGRLKVWTNFPIITKEGYIPVIVDVTNLEQVQVNLAKEDPTSTFESRQDFIVRLAEESRRKNALYYESAID